MATVVAVMGPVGSGKSTFVKTVTGSDEVVIGNNLMPETNVVRSFPVKIDGTDFVLIDTPGFDDLYLTNGQILERIAQWLEDTDTTSLTGIIYLHRINDNRLPGSLQRSARMFYRLCGDDYCTNIVMATTFWDCVDYQTGIRREAQLLDSENWSSILAAGAVVRRIQDYSMAHHLLMEIADKQAKPTVMQQKLSAPGAVMRDVVASMADSDEMQALKARQAAEVEAVKLENKRIKSEQKTRARTALQKIRADDRRILEAREVDRIQAVLQAQESIEMAERTRERLEQEAKAERESRERDNLVNVMLREQIDQVRATPITSVTQTRRHKNSSDAEAALICGMSCCVCLVLFVFIIAIVIIGVVVHILV